MNKNRVNEIDLLRFLAAMAVVFFHYSFRGYAADAMSLMPYPMLAPFSKYGYLGVELFFMISGFVIIMTASSGGLDCFLKSRIIRLYPAFWACCTITFIFTVAIGEPRYSVSVIQYLVNMTMLSGFVGVPAVDAVYWSLFVELRFYFLVAIVLIVGKIERAQVILFIWLFVSVFLEIWPLAKLRYFFIVDYSSFFIAGAAFYLLWSQGVSLLRLLLIGLSWGLSIFQSIKSLSGFESYYNVEMSSFVVSVVVSAFYFVMFFVSLRRTGVFGKKRWVAFGAVTYPLYLLHENIGFMIFNILYPSVNSHVLLWGMVVLAISAAYFVHYFVEKPFSVALKNKLPFLRAV